MRRALPVFPALVLLVFSIVSPLLAKGPTTKIVVTGSSLQRPIEITDVAVLRPFLVWAGAGTQTCIGGPAHCTAGTTGFIVDWTNGPVDAPQIGLPSYVVSFYTSPGNERAATQELAYVVTYAYDASTRQGYVYLPAKGEPSYEINVQSIRRGVEGHWFNASAAWQSVIVNLVN